MEYIDQITPHAAKIVSYIATGVVVLIFLWGLTPTLLNNAHRRHRIP